MRDDEKSGVKRIIDDHGLLAENGCSFDGESDVILTRSDNLMKLRAIFRDVRKIFGSRAKFGLYEAQPGDAVNTILAITISDKTTI